MMTSNYSVSSVSLVLPVVVLIIISCTRVSTRTGTLPTSSSSSASSAASASCVLSDAGLTLSCSRIFVHDDAEAEAASGGGEDFWAKWIQPPLTADFQLSRLQTLQILDSIFTPHLNMSLFNTLPGLLHLQVTNCTGCEIVVGQLTTEHNSRRRLTSLTLSYNNIEFIDLDSIFLNSDDNSNNGSASALTLLDLSYNRLSNVSLDAFNTSSHQLRKLGLKGNNFGCIWVRDDLFKWLNSNPQTELISANGTMCSSLEIAFQPIPIPFPIALALKKFALSECEESTNCSCDVRGYFYNKLQSTSFPFPNVITTPTLNATFGLKLDCAHMGLTALPPISPFTHALSVQHNQISNLERFVTDPAYQNLFGIDLSYNQLTSIDFLADPRFLQNFQFILLIGNRISQIPIHILAEVFSQERKNLMTIKLGGNEIDCDCFTFTKLKPLLINNEKVIDDWKEIRCRGGGGVGKSLKDLKMEDVCSNPDEDARSEVDLALYILTGLESILIVLILVKVWYDSRRYHATGNLPSCSLCIPRLPCDFMLEGLKDQSHHVHGHHNGGHGETATTTDAGGNKLSHNRKPRGSSATSMTCTTPHAHAAQVQEQQQQQRLLNLTHVNL